MVEVQLEGDRVVFEVKGWDKLWALSSRLSIPAAHIIDAHPEPNPEMGWFDGLKVMGTGLPDFFRAGTFFQKNDLVFWDVRHRENTIVVELEHEHFKRLIIEVADPEQTVATIRSVAGARRG